MERLAGVSGRQAELTHESIICIVSAQLLCSLMNTDARRKPFTICAQTRTSNHHRVEVVALRQLARATAGAVWTGEGASRFLAPLNAALLVAARQVLPLRCPPVRITPPQDSHLECSFPI